MALDVEQRGESIGVGLPHGILEATEPVFGGGDEGVRRPGHAASLDYESGKRTTGPARAGVCDGGLAVQRSLQT